MCIIVALLCIYNLLVIYTNCNFYIYNFDVDGLLLFVQIFQFSQLSQTIEEFKIMVTFFFTVTIVANIYNLFIKFIFQLFFCREFCKELFILLKFRWIRYHLNMSYVDSSDKMKGKKPFPRMHHLQRSIFYAYFLTNCIIIFIPYWIS